jgi:outer membrane protein OmpA-like peptidoglycan-associated protein
MSMAGPQITSALASRLQEPATNVRDGLENSATTILASLASKSSDSGFMSQIFGMITSPAASGISNSLATLASSGQTGSIGELAQKFLSLLFGGQLSSISSAIGGAAGLKPSSAQSLMSMAAPLVIGALSQKVSTGGLNAASLASLLGGQASALRLLVPAGVASLLPSAPSADAPAPREGGIGGLGWVVPMILAVLAVGAAWWMLGNRPNEAPAAPSIAKVGEAVKDTASSALDSAASLANSAWAALGEFFKRKLPNGVEIEIPRLGVENRLIEFIEDKGRPVDKTTWFDFDRLLFDTGKATLQPQSEAQLKAVAAILTAYPGVHVKVGGYTDNVGDKAANLKLSSDRAASVAAELVKLGIDQSRLSAEGYGEQHPVADNATEEGRSRNRRVSLRITRK